MARAAAGLAGEAGGGVRTGAVAVAGSFAGSSAGTDAAVAVEAAFLLVFVALAWRLARGTTTSDPAVPAATWGVALLLLALSMPYLLPWYAAWFAPLLGLLADETLVLAGALVTGVLALTLIPADPFHGLTSPGVMYGVHYGAASVLFVVLLVVGFRVTVGDGPDAQPTGCRHFERRERRDSNPRFTPVIGLQKGPSRR